MHHDHKAFDRSDPDAQQALEDALPIAAALITERAKPQPKDVELLRAWRAQIAELEDDLRLKAERAGCSPAELERRAAATVRRRQRTLSTFDFEMPTGRLPITRIALAAEEQELQRIRFHLETEQRRNQARHSRVLKRLTSVQKKLFAHGAAGLRGRG